RRQSSRPKPRASTLTNTPSASRTERSKGRRSISPTSRPTCVAARSARSAAPAVSPSVWGWVIISTIEGLSSSGFHRSWSGRCPGRCVDSGLTVVVGFPGARRDVEAALTEADVGVRAGDDDVVEDVDPEEVAGTGGLGGEARVLRRGGRIAGRVVVNQDDRRGVQTDRLAEDVGEADHRGVQPALVDQRRREDAVAGVQADDPQLLLGELPHLGPKIPGDVRRGMDLPTIARGVEKGDL